MADVEHEHRLHQRRNQLFDQRTHVCDDEIDDHNAEVDANSARREVAYRGLNQALAIRDLVAPECVVKAAGEFVSVAHNPRLHAEAAYTDEARIDLGCARTSHIVTPEFEPPVAFDSPESGVDRG